MKDPKIIFFIKGSVPTELQKIQASLLSSRTVFRNALYVPEVLPLGQVEACDAVTGIIPGPYSKMPLAEKVVKEHKDALKKRYDELLKEKKEKGIADKTQISLETVPPVEPTTPPANWNPNTKVPPK